MKLQNDQQADGREIATLGGGCFWCLEAIFEQLDGIETVVSGFSGGKVANPTYQEVSAGTTGDAEVVHLTFDPGVMSFEQILKVFFAVHDPTTLNRQGADIGPQYRSAIFYHSPDQKVTARRVIEEITKAQIWDAPIVTEVAPFGAFYKAEDYHQEYYRRNERQPYCQVVIAPKVAKFRKHYLAKLKAEYV